MRFPKIPFMQPVFDLIVKNKKNPCPSIPGMLTVIPYVMDNPHNLSFYNGIIKTDAELDVKPPPLDPFNTGIDPPGTVSDMVNAAIGDFKAQLETPPFVDGWNDLMKFDEYSTRDYIAFVKPKYNDTVSHSIIDSSNVEADVIEKLINYMETFDSATNLYDEALSESVMDSLDFRFKPNIKWYCIQ